MSDNNKCEDKEKEGRRDVERLEDTVMMGYKKTKALFEETDDYLVKLGRGDFVRENNHDLENSMIKFRKSFNEYKEKK